MAYDVLCIGNAIVDLISRVPEDFITANGLERGGMTLVDAEESGRRISLLSELSMTPGGSVANTAACLASLGSKVGFIGKVGNDPLGAFFREQMQSVGVDFLCEEDQNVPTASCLAVVTPDGERTMSTFLGACTHLSPNDIPADAIRRAKLVFVEGYLLDAPASRAAVERIFQIAAIVETPVAVTLSDSRCVERHLGTFERLADHTSCEIVIANEKELAAFARTTDTEASIRNRQEKQNVTVVTLGARGAEAAGRGHRDRVAAAKVENIVDLVGAGDAFAAGFLHAFVHREYIKDALGVGAKCAAIVIQQQGARPAVSLKQTVYAHVDDDKVFV